MYVTLAGKSTTTETTADSNMNDPELAGDRYQIVKKLKEEGVAKEDAWSEAQERSGRKFEGHMLKATVENIYG